MSEPEWRIRPARPGDRDLLASFACADPAVGWQVEAEQFIRTQLADWAFDPHAAAGDPRLLLAFVTATGDLFGVAAHERVILQDGGSTQIDATKLEVLAIATPWRGRRFHTGERASDIMMSAVDDRRLRTGTAARRTRLRPRPRRQPPQHRHLQPARAHRGDEPPAPQLPEARHAAPAPASDSERT
jgi:hypothetical protein